MTKKESKPKTHVLLLLDRSGSMASIADQAVVWYNEQVQQLKENAKTQDIEVSLITFNANVFEHMWRKPADELKEATIASYSPNGGTSLRDAMGYAIDKAMAEDEPNMSYLFICITDGDDTTSSKYQKTLIREIFQGIEKNQRWSHNLIGCEQDTIFQELAQMTGLDVSNMAKVSYDNVAGGVVRNRKSMGKYFAARAAGVQKVNTFHSDQAGCLADYSQTSANDVDLDEDDVACFKRISLPLNAVSHDAALCQTGMGEAIFAASSSNCVVSADATYKRPLWNIV
jgi:uncharacterized protein YegL